jgi:hypothetical protein
LAANSTSDAAAMPLSRLIYASRAVEALKPDDVEQILRTSRTNNARVGVTGALMFGAREFLQCLEGSREAVNQTYARILRDPRHADVVILDYREVGTRWFPTWGMHHVPPLWSSRQMLLRYHERETFAPTRMSAESATALLGDLARSLPVESGEVEAPVARAAPALGGLRTTR